MAGSSVHNPFPIQCFTIDFVSQSGMANIRHKAQGSTGFFPQRTSTKQLLYLFTMEIRSAADDSGGIHALDPFPERVRRDC